MKKILAILKQTDIAFELIEDGDIIGVGLSGGKDSITLLTALYYYRFYSKKNYTLIGIHISVKQDHFDPVSSYCQKLNIPYFNYPTQISEILELHAKEGKISCALCSNLIKGAIVKFAKSKNCNKIAYGHHLDDVLETFFLNMIHGASISTFAPKIFLSREEVTFIRPLYHVYEKDIARVANNLSLPVIESTCPNNHTSQRASIKLLIKDINEKFPQSRENLLNMFKYSNFKNFKNFN